MVFLSGFVSADGLTAREMSVADLQRHRQFFNGRYAELAGEVSILPVTAL